MTSRGLFSLLFAATLGSSLAHGQDGPGDGSAVALANSPAYVSPFIGLEATGGTVAACPAGRMMVGIAGTKVNSIKTVTPLCARVSKDGSFAIVAPVDPSAIASGARGFRL